MVKFFVGIIFSSVKSDYFFRQVTKIITDKKLMPTKIITDKVFTDNVFYMYAYGIGQKIILLEQLEYVTIYRIQARFCTKPRHIRKVLVRRCQGCLSMIMICIQRYIEESKFIKMY